MRSASLPVAPVLPVLPALLASLALLALPAFVPPAAAQAAPLVDLEDPEGDDVGDGSLVYPREGLVPGELDLRRLRVHAERDALRLEATFAQPIRDPASVKSQGLGNEDLSVFARRGFFAFNLDIYLDLDRRPGSGRTATLPGRGATLDAAHAWDKAIVLTPRPELMQRQLREAVPDDKELADAVHFATDVRVRGRTVSFTVPRGFLGSLDAARWSLTAFVTAAKTTADLGLLASETGARAALGVLQPEPGLPERAMGYRGGKAPSTAIVDLLAPDAGAQAAQLAAGARLAGAGAPSVAAAAIAAPAPTPAPRAPSVTGQTSAPSGAAAPAAPAAPIVPAVPTAAAAATAPAAAPAAPRAAAAAPAPPPGAAASAARAGPRDAAYFEEQELRLRSLKRLRDANLISEEEYRKKRREILDRL
jgi:hypothetical protein